MGPGTVIFVRLVNMFVSITHKPLFCLTARISTGFFFRERKRLAGFAGWPIFFSTKIIDHCSLWH